MLVHGRRHGRRWRNRPDLHRVTLKFDANGGNGAPSKQSISGGTSTLTSASFYIPETVPTRFGYKFIGWNLFAGATGATYQPGDQIRVMYGETETLYAVWAQDMAPVLTVPGDETLHVGDVFAPMDGVTAWDREDGDITAKVIVTGIVDTSKPGKTTLTYSVTDSNGSKVTKRRVITVVNPTVSEIPETGGTHVQLIAAIALMTISAGIGIIISHRRQV